MYKKRRALTYTLEESLRLFSETMDMTHPMCRLASVIDWHFIEDLYARHLSPKANRYIDARAAFGALLLREITHLNSAKIRLEIGNNEWFQFFLGYPARQTDPIFSVTSINHFSSRFPAEDLQLILWHQAFELPADKASAYSADPKAVEAIFEMSETFGARKARSFLLQNFWNLILDQCQLSGTTPYTIVTPDLLEKKKPFKKVMEYHAPQEDPEGFHQQVLQLDV